MVLYSSDDINIILTRTGFIVGMRVAIQDGFFF